LIPTSATPTLLSTVPLKEIRGLGGKLGEAVLAFAGGGCKTAMDFQQRFPEEAPLVARFGEKEGRWLYRICRGVDEEMVVPNEDVTLVGVSEYNQIDLLLI
jgi:DNA polymerase eta